MLLWTILPLEAIFPTEAFHPDYDEIEYQGARMVVEKVSPDSCQIVRIISTNPQDYLRIELQPGKVLKYNQL